MAREREGPLPRFTPLLGAVAALPGTVLDRQVILAGSRRTSSRSYNHVARLNNVEINEGGEDLTFKQKWKTEVNYAGSERWLEPRGKKILFFSLSFLRGEITT